MPNEPMNLQHMTPGKFLHHRPRLVACLLALLVPLRPAPLCAQSANDGFDPAVNNRVDVSAVQSDGKILIAGLFTMVGGTNRVGLARLNVDGSVDASFFAPQIFGGLAPIRAIVVQDDGRIILGGFFKTPAPFARTNLVRLNADGSADTNFVADADNTVESLLLLPDGKILVGGYFKTISQMSPFSLARLHPNGRVDTNFTTRANYGVLAMLRQPDGRVLVSGQFSTINGVPRNNLGRLNADGSVDLSFNPGVILNPSPNDSVVSLALQADGRWLAAGYFAITNQTPRRNLLRFQPDGSLDASFPVVTNTSVNRIALQPDGRLVVGGQFTQIGSQPRTNLARLMPDGSLDAGFAPVANGGSGNGVRAVTLQGDGKILIGGGFATVAGQSRTNLARLYADGSLDATLNPGIDSYVGSLTWQPDGKILVAGAFEAIRRLHSDGGYDPNFASSVFNEDLDSFTQVMSLAVQRDGKILVGGFFTLLAGQARQYFGRLNSDGSLDEAFNPHATTPISVVFLQADGRIIVGGGFGEIGGEPRTHVARLDVNGVVDPQFHPEPNGVIGSVVEQPDGKIVVAGYFTSLAGEPRLRIGRLHFDGTLDDTFNPSADGPVRCLALQADGKIVVGGIFGALNGQPRNRIGRLNPDGTLDNSFNPGANGWVDMIVLRTDGKILVGGEFTTLGNRPRRGMGLLNPDGSVDETFDAGAGDSVFSLAIQPDGKILVGSECTTLGGQGRCYIGRLTSSDAALQALVLDGSGKVISWKRGGSGPEIHGVTFETSPDGITYTNLGLAARASAGWQLAGLSLPAGSSFYIRARGRVVNGYWNASSGIVESIAQFWRLPPPFLSNVLVLGGSGQFQFSFTNTNAVAFAVLASTNAAAPLAQWESLGAPVSVGGGTYQFTDPGATNHARRFYQLRSP